MAKKKAGADKLVVQNAAKTLLANIRFSSVDNPIRVITLTSSTPNEGKSTVALNLAQAIATSGKSVVLVECDMRRRSLADMIGARTRGGLYAVLSEQMTIEEAVVETSQKNLYFLDSEPHIPNPADIIASKRFRRLVEALRETFQYVIFDTPPVGTFVDAAEVGHLSDGVLFVVRENFAKRAEVQAAFDQLRRAEVNVIGAVMNYCEAETSEYYYSYYTKDGKKVRKSDDVQAVPQGKGAQGASSGLASSSRFGR
ncbi:MAG: CpsD/CapB family tyrosine-protein kinase [Collinsella phocaeensis]|uniref:CpsD/CapB family tyrosine-protein kinase n=1 Tax=Collinsella phocaeensis TaxID=1871016 RepID=UPI0009F91409|nr:CpsD/CapB family tyrosine-protein kinase [Collinsella phocaeensis]